MITNKITTAATIATLFLLKRFSASFQKVVLSRIMFQLFLLVFACREKIVRVKLEAQRIFFSLISTIRPSLPSYLSLIRGSTIFERSSVTFINTKKVAKKIVVLITMG